MGPPRSQRRKRKSLPRLCGRLWRKRSGVRVNPNDAGYLIFDGQLYQSLAVGIQPLGINVQFDGYTYIVRHGITAVLVPWWLDGWPKPSQLNPALPMILCLAKSKESWPRCPDHPRSTPVPWSMAEDSMPDPDLHGVAYSCSRLVLFTGPKRFGSKPWRP